MKHKVDIAIIGAGFAGSILASILARAGCRVALIDATHHPRFAIGESSTPIADMILRRLATLYQLPHLEALSTWGSWQAQFPNLACGRKRGFSYYQHVRDQDFSEDHLGQHSLLVAASAKDSVADTHWYRQDVDEFLFAEAVKQGVLDLMGHAVHEIDSESTGRSIIRCKNQQGQASVATDWLIDASGTSAVSAKRLGQQTLTETLRTHTRTAFGHYDNVGRWSDQLQQLGQNTQRDPFDCDDAAQHHLLNDGWVWMLRFNNGITSVGRTEVMGGHTNPINHDLTDYPSLAQLMTTASFTAPTQGLQVSGRIQQLYRPVISQRQLLLPTAALTLDPLHSTGISHALAGVDRISRILLTGSANEQQDSIQQYESTFFEESYLLDQLVSTAYCVMHDFERFTAACMIYFAGAIRCEERYQQCQNPTHLWNADDPAFVDFATKACQLLVDPRENHEEFICTGIGPWNTAGLMDRKVANRYAYTATK